MISFQNPNSKEVAIEEIQTISEDGLIQFKKEVRENLKSSFSNGQLAYPLKIYKWKIRKGEDFFTIMVRFSLDQTTLLSLNKIFFKMNIEDYQENKEIYLPNARGFFLTEDKYKEANKIEISMKDSNQKIYFYPGKRLSILNMNFIENPKEENKVKIEKEFFPPLEKGMITSLVGRRKNPFTGSDQFHTGIDIKTEINSEVYAIIEGEIIFAGYKKGYGNTVILANGKDKFLYAHLSYINVKKGEKVKRGEKLGSVGITGLTTGPHLHLEWFHQSKLKDASILFPQYLD